MDAVPVEAVAVVMVLAEVDGRLGIGFRLSVGLSPPPQPIKIEIVVTTNTIAKKRFFIVIYLFSFSNFSARKCLNSSMSAGTSKPRNSLRQS